MYVYAYIASFLFIIIARHSEHFSILQIVTRYMTQHRYAQISVCSTYPKLYNIYIDF